MAALSPPMRGVALTPTNGVPPIDLEPQERRAARPFLPTEINRQEEGDGSEIEKA
jgi:hypothetical protein